MKKYLPPVLAVALIAIGIGLQFVELPVIGSGPITMAVMIEESADRVKHQDETNVASAKTSQELRKVDKWRQWDKDELPPGLAEEVGPIDTSTLPKLYLFRGNKVIWSGPMVKTDPDLARTIAKHGGF